MLTHVHLHKGTRSLSNFWFEKQTSWWKKKDDASDLWLLNIKTSQFSLNNTAIVDKVQSCGKWFQREMVGFQVERTAEAPTL